MLSGGGKIQNVPTHVITGFLGTGKTSAILHLLGQRPVGERWAVLVNEFGEIGVDGNLLGGQHPEAEGVFVREVPGGCMCCTAGLPMQVALNELLRRARPDRLLIEPTGLGHPHEVMGVLTGDRYRGVLAIRKVITLVDARHLSDARYTGSATFKQQIALADVVVGNKADLYGEGDREALVAYTKEHGRPGAQMVITERGALDPAWLDGVAGGEAGGDGDVQRDAAVDSVGHHHGHSHQHGHSHDHPHDMEAAATPLADMPFPTTGIVKAENEGEGYRSVGWRFAADRVFDRAKLRPVLEGLRAERMKAVFLTGDGVFGYNLASGDLTEMVLREGAESRIEILAEDIDADWEDRILACSLDGSS